MQPKLILTLILGLIINTVLQAQTTQEHQLKSGLQLELADCVNKFDETDLTYTWVEGTGLVRRERNRFCLFDTTFAYQWQTTIPLDYQNYDYLYRCATDKEYMYLAWYSPIDRKDNPGLRFGKINLSTGAFTECVSDRIKEFKSSQYIRIHHDTLYVFGTTHTNNLMWDNDKIKEPHYTSGVFVLDKELSVNNYFEIPTLEGAQTQFNWMFMGCDDSGFTYVTNLSQRTPGVFKAYSPGSSPSEIKHTFSYDFELKKEKIKRKFRDWYNLNPIKFDTTHFTVIGPAINEYCVTGKFLYNSPSNRSDQNTTVYYLYKNLYTPINLLYVKNKATNTVAGPIGSSDRMLNRKRSLKYSFYFLVDLVEDPLNESITVILTHQFEVGHLYILNYDASMQLISFTILDELYSNLELANDNNFVSVPSKTKQLIPEEGIAGKKNAFDYMCERGHNKFCTVMALKNRQILFMDDPEKGTTTALEIFPD